MERGHLKIVVGGLMGAWSLIFLFLLSQDGYRWSMYPSALPGAGLILVSLAFDLLMIILWELSLHLYDRNSRYIPVLTMSFFLGLVLLISMEGQDFYSEIYSNRFLGVAWSQIYYNAYFLLLVSTLVLLIQTPIMMWFDGKIPASACYASAALLICVMSLFAIGGWEQAVYGMAAPIALCWGSMRSNLRDGTPARAGASAVTVILAIFLLPLLVWALIVVFNQNVY